MLDPLLSAADAFRSIYLGDRRLTKRLVHSVRMIQEDPSRSFPEAFGTSANLEGYYRLVNNERLDHMTLTDHLADDAYARAISVGEVGGAILVLHDTTEHAFDTDQLRPGLVRRGKTQSFWQHGAIAVSELGLPQVHGVIGSHNWVIRDKKWIQVVQGDKEVPTSVGSDRWMQLFEEVRDRTEGDARVVHVMDREGDMFPLLAEMSRLGSNFVVRASHNRLADADNTKLADILSLEPVIALRDVDIKKKSPSKKGPPKGRKARKARKARLSVRFGQVELQQPAAAKLRRSGSLTITVVDVLEEKPPAGEPPIHWRLYTNLPVTSVVEAMRIVDIYRRRWLIEEFFKAVKTGCSFRKRQANTRRSLLDTLAILLPVAVSILNLRAVARIAPKSRWYEVIDEVTLTVLQTFPAGKKVTKRSNARTIMLAIAALGGHLKSNGEPGWITLGRGMEKLVERTAGWRAAMDHMGLEGNIRRSAGDN